MSGSSPTFADLESAVRAHASAVVAFSGGVDSAVVAAAAQRALGERALAVTIIGPAVPLEEVQRASLVARAIGVRHRLVRHDPTQDDRYAANPADRCYFCRGMEGRLLAAIAEEEGYAAILDGIHLDDLGDDRPGLRAMNELGVRHPLLECKVGKQEVRAFARALGLPNAETPSNSCLASRIQHGERVTPELLARVEAAEIIVRRRGFRQVRVRTSQGAARVEVGKDELPRLRDPELRHDLERALLGLHFVSVEFDPEGYRPGGQRLKLLPTPTTAAPPRRAGPT